MRFAAYAVVSAVLVTVGCGSATPRNLEGAAFALHVTTDAQSAARAADVDLPRLVIASANKSLALLPHHGQFRITVQIDPEQAIPWVGVGGFTDGDGNVSIAIDPAHSDLRHALETWIPAVVAHELHHSSRIRSGPGYGRTLGQAMVSEGLADRFVDEVFPQTPPQPWDHALMKAQQRTFWLRARPLLNRDDYSHRDWFFGGGTMPRAVGYTLGYDIVGHYLAQHHESASDAVALPARKALAGFGG